MIVSLFLWTLNYFFPNRNAGVGLRFPGVFRTLNKWQRFQSRFYLTIITTNALILIYFLITNMNDNKIIAYSIASIIVSGLLTFFSPFKK